MNSRSHGSDGIRLRPDEFEHQVKIDHIERNREDGSIASGGSEQMIIHRKVEWNVETM